IQIALESASNECVSDTLGACLNYVSKIGAEIVVGGRYLPDPSDSSCKWAEDFEAMQTPWLVPGFTRGVTVDPTTGVAYRRECRDTLRPFDDGKLADLNASLAGANPVPDGRSRVRELEIIDGAMINQETLLIFFKEVFSEGEAADEATQLVAYGIMQLERQPATLDYNDFDGALQNEDRDQDKGLLTVQCSEEIVEKALGLTELPEEWNPAPIDPADLNSLVWALVDGMDPLAGGNTAGDVGETI
ncbi:MAG: hypothetical protein GY856_31195, partial [bacterium]|nr:hypothetical protein [bacterium]